MVQFSHPYMTAEKSIALTRQNFVSNASAFEYTVQVCHSFSLRSKRLLISWLQSPSAVIFELQKIKSVTSFLFLTELGRQCSGFSWWPLSSCGVQAFCCGGFSCCGARALEHMGFSNCAHRLSCPIACKISPDQGANPCPLHCRQILNHWTTREVQASDHIQCTPHHHPFGHSS